MIEEKCKEVNEDLIDSGADIFRYIDI